VRLLERHRASRKLTPEIKAYVRARWPDLVKEGLYGIGKRLNMHLFSPDPFLPLAAVQPDSPAAQFNLSVQSDCVKN
jgi:hypothetical protein